MTNLTTLSLSGQSINPSLQTPRNHLLTWQFREALNIICAATLFGFLYSVFADGFISIIPYINGSIIGFLGGLGLALGEFVFFSTIRKRTNFIIIVSLKSASYTLMMTLIIFTVILFSRSIEHGKTIKDTFYGDAFQHLLFHEDFTIMVFYAMTFVSVLIFTKEMSRKMGQGVLFNFITGRYFKPKVEKRIFMFLDMSSSVSKAERLGDMEYHDLLNDFFRDTTECILLAGGKIHHYVGDEVVVSWPLKPNINTESCLKAYFNSVEKMKLMQPRYQNKYGLVPHFKAAFHCGEVVCGEIGEVKSEIVFHGDVINTTARLERMCSELHEDILVSKALFDTFTSGVRNIFRSAGFVKIRGKEQTMEVFGLCSTVAL